MVSEPSESQAWSDLRSSRLLRLVELGLQFRGPRTFPCCSVWRVTVSWLFSLLRSLLAPWHVGHGEALPLLAEVSVQDVCGRFPQVVGS